MGILELGVIAALLQVTGYLVYGSKVLTRDIRPNATSWLMFAYGNMLLLVLEWDRDASFAIMALPIACTLSSIAVAWYCLRQSKRAWWPEHTLDRFSFVLDILLTISYILAWVLLSQEIIDENRREIVTIFILACWNIGIFTAYFPLLRQVYSHPSTEHAAPWFIWTAAYSVLAIVTAHSEGFVTELILYPVILAVVCGWIAIHTARWQYMHNHPIL